MDYFRHGIDARLEDKPAATKRVNDSVNLLAQRLENGHSLYGKNTRR